MGLIIAVAIRLSSFSTCFRALGPNIVAEAITKNPTATVIVPTLQRARPDVDNITSDMDVGSESGSPENCGRRLLRKGVVAVLHDMAWATSSVSLAVPSLYFILALPKNLQVPKSQYHVDSSKGFAARPPLHHDEHFLVTAPDATNIKFHIACVCLARAPVASQPSHRQQSFGDFHNVAGGLPARIPPPSDLCC